MKRFKAFAYVFRNSISSVEYYTDVLKATTKFSLKYFYMLAMLATVIVTLRVTLPILPEAEENIYKSLEEFSNVYPENFVIEAENGEWTINQPEPYTITAPETFKAEEMGFPENIIVFDREGTINSFRDSDALIMVNKANIMIMDSTGNIDVVPLEGIPDGVFTKANFNNFVETLAKFARFAPIFVFMIILIGSAFYYFIYRLLSLLTVALFLSIIGKFNKFGYDFGQYFRISVHAFTLPLTVEILLSLIGTSFFVPLWFFIVNASFGLYIILKLKQTQVTGKETEIK